MYDVILADPPWHFRVRSSTGLGSRSAERHYPTMTLPAIQALPVAPLCNPHATLFLWACLPMLPEALAVIASWGFSYKTVAFTWAKMNMKAPGPFMGCGYWTRANAELCLLATKGHPRRVATDVRQLILAPRTAHSAKPPEARERISRLMGPGRYLELFARERLSPWDSWGFDVTGDQTLADFTLEKQTPTVYDTDERVRPAPPCGGPPPLPLELP